MADVGFIGLGSIGMPMAANLVEVGHAVVGFDVVPVALEAAGGEGGAIVAAALEASPSIRATGTSITRPLSRSSVGMD